MKFRLLLNQLRRFTDDELGQDAVFQDEEGYFHDIHAIRKQGGKEEDGAALEPGARFLKSNTSCWT